MLTSGSLQLIAIVTMLIDHVGLYLCDNNIGMRIIGRFAMPLFCFMLSEGFLHTKGKRWKYFGRLAIFALISQLPYDLLHMSVIPDAPKLNVMFTLIVGFMSMAMIEYSGWTIIGLPIMLIIAEYFNMDYGAYGVIMIVGFYLITKLLGKKKQQLWRWLGYIFILFSATSIYVVAKHNSLQLAALLAIIPIVLYSGKLGKRLPKWFGYIFYPAHLLAIFIIKSLFMS